MSNIDNRGRLQENPFSYKMTKANKIIIFYENRQIMILSEASSMRLHKRMNGKSDFDIQMELAKVTGNFKRGNERK